MVTLCMLAKHPYIHHAVQVSIDVRGKHNLEESLDLYVQGELMEGDNQYFCESVGKKVSWRIRYQFYTLP